MNEYENHDVINDLKGNDNYLGKVFLYMFMGLLSTGIISYITYASGLMETWATNGVFTLVLFIELVVVVLFSVLFRLLPPYGVTILFFLYSIINGLTMGVIYEVYALSSIVLVFFATAIFYAILAFIGYNTEKDLSKIGTIAGVALIVCIIVSLINLFLNLTIIDTIMDWVIIILFAGITAYDVQKIKGYESTNEKAYIYGAMDLYLDFINIFLRLLSIFGKRRD
jgi:hypothetical protein